MSESGGGGRRVRCLGVEAPGRLYFWEYDEPPLAAGQARLETLYTGLSAGTELTFFKGSNPYLRSRWDEDLCLFEPSRPGATFPVPFLGYMEVGRVLASRCGAVREGALLAMTYGHKSGHTADLAQEFAVELPEGLDPLLGIYVAQMGPICANGLLHAAADAVGPRANTLAAGVNGRCVLVTGGGVIGLLIAAWARALGAAEVAVADATPERLRAAAACGALPIDANEEDAAVWAKQRWRHGPCDRGADVAFQCRGAGDALHTALRSLRPQAAVIDLAFYQGGAAAVHLGEEFHHNGLRIQCAQIGRPPRGMSHLWSRRRLAHETLQLLADQGEALRRNLVTDVLPLEGAQQVFEDLAARRRHALQVVFSVAR